MDLFLKELRQSFRGDIADDEATLTTYSTDASVFVVRPKLVVYPRDAADVGTLVRLIAKYKHAVPELSLTARAAGTDMSGGPLSESVIADCTRYLNKIRAVTRDSVTAQPGAYWRDVESHLKKRHLMMPSYPASRGLCAVGGIVSNNSGGEKTLRYGKTAKYVTQVKMVLRDGNEYVFGKISAGELAQKCKEQTVEAEVYRAISALVRDNTEVIEKAKPHIAKNSSGYALWDVRDDAAGTFDLAKLIVGSQGTLGIITEATFSLVPVMPNSRLLVIFLKDLNNLGTLTNHILSHDPESLESYDDHTFTLAMKLLPDIIKQMKGNLFMLAWRFLPEAWAILTGGVPKLILMAEFTAPTAEGALAQAKRAHQDLSQFNLKMRITRSKAEVEKYWVIRRESFSLLRKHTVGRRTAPCIDDIAVAPEHLPEFLPKLYEILDRYDLTYTIAGHVGNGNFHIIPLMDFRRPDATDVIYGLMDEVFKLTFSYGGTMTAEHNDGLIRTPYLKAMFGADMAALFVKTKEIFDPEHMFNPGKKVTVTKEYAREHIAHAN